jgi:DNA end-binding protein Ku
LKQLNVDSETGDVVRREDIARGFEVTKGENEDIDAVQIESTRTIEIDQFVPRGGDR